MQPNVTEFTFNNRLKYNLSKSLVYPSVDTITTTTETLTPNSHYSITPNYMPLDKSFNFKNNSILLIIKIFNYYNEIFTNYIIY